MRQLLAGRWAGSGAGTGTGNGNGYGGGYGGGGGGAGGGSNASILVEFDDVTIDDVGYGKFDADGLRVEERGPGSINASITGSTFRGVGFSPWAFTASMPRFFNSDAS